MKSILLLERFQIRRLRAKDKKSGAVFVSGSDCTLNLKKGNIIFFPNRKSKLENLLGGFKNEIFYSCRTAFFLWNPTIKTGSPENMFIVEFHRSRLYRQKPPLFGRVQSLLRHTLFPRSVATNKLPLRGIEFQNNPRYIAAQKNSTHPQRSTSDGVNRIFAVINSPGCIGRIVKHLNLSKCCPRNCHQDHYQRFFHARSLQLRRYTGALVGLNSFIPGRPSEVRHAN